MMKQRPAELMSWVEEVRGAEVSARLQGEWAEFSQIGRPVATLFGAYDTGKSSILRRLAVEAGVKIPDWLTVSARHETFTANLLLVDDFWLRDTPGLSPDGQDLRSVGNSSTAREMVGLTDLLLVTLNPQLATGERPDLLSVLAQEWPEDGIWFLISRADEGGVDPEFDPDGFAFWSELKRTELRESLHLDDSARIFTVVPDFGQAGSFSSDPDPHLWDQTRQWDGMRELQAALREWASRDHAVARSAAEVRFWKNVVSATLAELRLEQSNLKTSTDVAQAALRRRDLLLRQLNTLQMSAEATIEAAIGEAIRRLLTLAEVDTAVIQESVEPVLEEWWDKQHAELAKIGQDAITSFAQQRERPAWQVLESVYGSFTTPDVTTSTAPRFSPLATNLLQRATESLHEVDEVRRAHDRIKHPAKIAASGLDAVSKGKAGLSLGEVAGMASAVLPLVNELGSLIETTIIEKKERERREERRRELTAEITRIVRNAAAEARKKLLQYFGGLRDQIKEAAGVTDSGADGMERRSVALAGLLERGEALVAVTADPK
jgi:hypothetical protein